MNAVFFRRVALVPRWHSKLGDHSVDTGLKPRSHKEAALAFNQYAK